jgi:hypothetical protein
MSIACLIVFSEVKMKRNKKRGTPCMGKKTKLKMKTKIVNKTIVMKYFGEEVIQNQNLFDLSK